MLPNKIENTPELSSMITSLRKENTQKNGKVMSKEQVSLAMGKGRTWLSQIETGRLKKVSSEDLTKVFEIVLDIDHDEATEKVEEYYDDIIEQNNEFSNVMQKLNSAIKEKYLECQDKNERKKLFTFLGNFAENLKEERNTEMTNPNEYNFLDYKLLFYRGKYQCGLGTVLYAFLSNGQPYGSISINFEDVKLPKDQIFMDMNNLDDLCDQMEKDGLLERTGLEKQSGYCIYPAARITEKLEKILNEL